MISVYYFTAAWCGACKGARPHVLAVCRDVGAEFVECDVGADPQLGIAHRVCTLPTILIFRDGEEQSRLEGAVSRQGLLGMMHSVISERA
jgi:thioredoxin 1